jgi:hypothetical protein
VFTRTIGDMAKPGNEEPKRCFLITPIGEEGSDTRRRSDQMLRYIVNPILEDCGYEAATRPDHLGKPGLIVPAVIERVMDDPLVIADLSDRDPIVYYLLAIRHMARKPLVKMIDASQPSPFDVAQSRTIRVDTHDLDSVEYCRRELRQQIRHVERKPQDSDNPINNFVDLMHLRQSGDPEKQYWAQLFEMIREMQISLEAAMQRFQAFDALRYGDSTAQAPAKQPDRANQAEGDATRARSPEVSGVDVSRLTSMLAEMARDLPKGPR